MISRIGRSMRPSTSSPQRSSRATSGWESVALGPTFQNKSGEACIRFSPMAGYIQHLILAPGAVCVSEPIISVSGLRGIVGESLTPLIAARYVTAFSGTLKNGPVLVSRDGRASGPMLAQIVCGTLVACGRRVLYADVASTPTLGVLVRANLGAGGVQISASHNPSAYNGLKLFSADGRVLPAAAGQPVLDAYRNSSARWASADQLGVQQQLGDTVGHHLALILPTVDAHAISSRRFRVLLDSNSGAGSFLGQRLLMALG